MACLPDEDHEEADLASKHGYVSRPKGVLSHLGSVSRYPEWTVSQFGDTIAKKRPYDRLPDDVMQERMSHRLRATGIVRVFRSLTRALSEQSTRFSCGNKLTYNTETMTRVLLQIPRSGFFPQFNCKHTDRERGWGGGQEREKNNEKEKPTTVRCRR